MAIIKPFRPLRPNPLYVDKLILTAARVSSVGDDAVTLKDMLENVARQRPENRESQLQAFDRVKQTLDELIDNARLYRELHPGIYVYEIVHKNYRQTGIWATIAVDEYRKGRIKTHELTLTDSVRRMRNYREYTGLEGSPVLLTYLPSVAVNRVIATVRKQNEKISYGDNNGTHHIWKIDDKHTQRQLMDAFAAISHTYLADGHHRLASTDGPDTISALFMATDQLRFEPYHRVVLKKIAQEKLLEELSVYFKIKLLSVGAPVQPKKIHYINLCVNEKNYELVPRTMPADDTVTDAAILQECVFGPIFGITDPRTDPALKYAGGALAMEEIGVILAADPEAIIFTVAPLTVEQLIAVADAGKNLPPKSTWIDPKVPYGLLLNVHQADAGNPPVYQDISSRQ